MTNLFALPNELVLSTLSTRFPCREQQIRTLAALISPYGAPSRNVVVHGLEATGKTAITKALLNELLVDGNAISNDGLHIPHSDLRYALIKSAECITGRHLLEQTYGAVAKALDSKGKLSRCESLSQLVVGLGKLLDDWTAKEGTTTRFVLVFDGIDKQRDPPPTLLQALARLGEIIPSLTTIFIVTSPRPSFLHLPGVPHILFPAYTKLELLEIISHTKPQPPLPSGEEDTDQVWSRFTTAVHDSLSKHSGRDILSFRDVCTRLWPQFVKPILDGQLNPIPFSKLMVANRALFQNDSALVHDIISTTENLSLQTPLQTHHQNKYHNIASLLPTYSRLLLVAAYLASFNPSKTDIIYFTKAASAKRRKRGGGTALTRPGVSKTRKISRKLLGAQAFVLERMLAIFHAIREDSDVMTKGTRAGKRRRINDVNGSADIQMAMATLVSLRLVVRMGAANQADVLDAGVRYRVAVGWEVVQGVGRSVGVEVEDYVAE